MEYTDKNTGIKIRVFSTMYLDWGLEITHPNCEQDLFYNPSFLSNESYGIKPNRLAEDLDLEYEEWSTDEQYHEPWDDEDWARVLKDEFDDLVEMCIGWGTLEQDFPEIFITEKENVSL